MEGLMRKLVSTVGLAVAFAAMAASSASATSGPAMLTSHSPFGTASNTAVVAKSEGPNLGAHLFTATSAQVSCSEVDFRVTTVTTNTSTIDPSYSGCTFIVSGTPLGTATVDSACTWDLSFVNAVFNDSTGVGSGGTATNCATQVTIPGIGCTLDVFAQTSEGISSQNVDTSGAATTVATPWGSKITATNSGLTYTTTGSCPGLSEHGKDAAYSGSVYVKDVWGML
jgi:hypothetical protein